MGEVYRARDTRLDRDVAIKVLSPGLASHLSCFVDLRSAPAGSDLNQALFNQSVDRLQTFFAYQAVFNPRTRFLVYSRGRQWSTREGEDAWIGEVAARFPQLTGRLFTMVVPGGAKATFRDQPTAAMLLGKVEQILRLP